jgi:hypothetical protein
MHARWRDVAAAMTVLALGAGCSLQSSADGNPAGASLAGAWRGNVQFTDGLYASTKDLEFLYAFNAGGTMTESSNYDEAQPVTPAYGIWRETGTNRFEAKYVFYNTKPPAHLPDLATGGGWLPAGPGTLVETITLAPDGQSYESKLTLDLVDQSGKPVPGASWHATVHATRIRF